MGKRVHVAKRYEVEWGKTADFNWSDETFIDILNALGADVARDGEYSDDFEVGLYSYYDAIENLRVYISDPSTDKYFSASIFVNSMSSSVSSLFPPLISLKIAGLATAPLPSITPIRSGKRATVIWQSFAEKILPL